MVVFFYYGFYNECKDVIFTLLNLSYIPGLKLRTEDGRLVFKILINDTQIKYINKPNNVQSIKEAMRT